MELHHRLPARARLHPRHRAPDRAGRRAQQGAAGERGRLQLRLAAARRGAGRICATGIPATSAEELQRRYRIGNALFIAADIDLQTFARAHLPALSEIAARTQVYLSEDDRALVFAAKLAGASRLGRPNFDELSREDLETLASNERLVGVDVAGVYGAHETTGMRGHGYWFANQRVSTDVLLSMVYPFDPTWRGLDHAPGPGLWTFPDDYPERVGRAVYEAAPELRREPAPARPSPPGNPPPDR